MAVSELSKEKELVGDGNDSIVIVNDLGDIPGGRTLANTKSADDEGNAIDYIPAGVPVYIDTDGEYYAYVFGLGENNEADTTNMQAVGILKKSVLLSDPRAAIMTIGQVNGAAMPGGSDAEYVADVKSDLPRIEFLYV